MESDSSSSSFSEKPKPLRPPSLSLSISSFSGADDRPPLIRSPSTWLRSKPHSHHQHQQHHHHHHHLLLPSPFTSAGGRHRRRHSADFRYDPVSYALNFDDDGGGGGDGADPGFRCFSSRLPPSPPKLAAAEARNKAKGKESPL